VSVTAKLKFLRVSPFKVRKYAQLFKGKPIDEAKAILAYHPSPTCESILKLLNSAVANAENNFEMDPEMMFVRNVLVDGGPTYKRMRPRARGRGNQILKRTCHVIIELDLQDKYKTASEAAKPEEKTVKPKRRAAKPAATKATKAEAPAKAKAATAAKPKATAKASTAAKAPKAKKAEAPAEKPKARAKAADKSVEVEAVADKPKRARSTKKAAESVEDAKSEE
jgi:large subunit ribosomal protein L22